jgi:hypothetical protein
MIRGMNRWKISAGKQGTTDSIVLIGMVIFFIGAIITTAAINTDADESYEDRYEDSRNMYKIGIIIVEIGFLFIATTLIVGSILNREIDITIRKGMMAAAVTLIIATIVLILFSPLMSLSLMA